MARPGRQSVWLACCCALALATVVATAVFRGRGREREAFEASGGDPNKFLIDNTADYMIKPRFAKALKFRDTDLFAVLFGDPNVPLLVPDPVVGNGRAARVNRAHPAAYVFGDLLRRELALGDSAARYWPYKIAGVLFNKKVTVANLWGNVFEGHGPSPGLRVVFRGRVKHPQMVGFLQRVALLTKKSMDVWRET